MSGQQSYTGKEIISHHVYYKRCGVFDWRICARPCSEWRYVQSYVTFYYVGFECCVGYRNVGTDGKLLCEPYPELFFQLLFTTQFHSCELWKDFGREIDFAKELSVRLSSICACHIYQKNITDVQVVCNDKMPDVLVFQGRIISTDERNASELIDDLESIVSNRENFTVSDEIITTLDNCTCCNIITEFELGQEPAANECVDGITDDAENESIGVIVGSITGGGAMLVVLIVIIILVNVLLRNRLLQWCRGFRNIPGRNDPQREANGQRDGGPL